LDHGKTPADTGGQKEDVTLMSNGFVTGTVLAIDGGGSLV
jgi:hypothetical protein